jgi:hypothetical protein
MAELALSPLLTLLDSVAKQVEVCEGAFGLLGTETGTVSKGAANNVATIQAIADVQVQADLSAVVRQRASLVLAGVIGQALYGPPLQRALDRHYGATVGSLGRFLETQDARVHPLLRSVGFQIDPLRAFCPVVVDPVASFTLTGAGAGTFTAGTPIDTTQYGKARMVLEAETLIGASPITVSCAMRKENGTQETKVVTVPAGTASGTTFSIGTAGVDLYVACLSITVAGGTAADAVTVKSQIERVIAL